MRNRVGITVMAPISSPAAIVGFNTGIPRYKNAFLISPLIVRNEHCIKALSFNSSGQCAFLRIRIGR